MMRNIVVVIACMAASLQAYAQDAVNTGKFLLAESTRLIEKRECSSLRSALEVLTAYERLAEAYKLEPSKKDDILVLSGVIKTNCGSSSGTTGSFVNFRKINADGQVEVEAVPAFIYSSFFMDDESRDQYLKNLDAASQEVYVAWKASHTTTSLALKQQTDELKKAQRDKDLSNMMEKIKMNRYNLTPADQQKLTKDLKDAVKF